MHDLITVVRRMGSSVGPHLDHMPNPVAGAVNNL